MAVTPVLACYRTCDAAIGGITAWQVTTGPDGPRTNVVGSCPLGCLLYTSDAADE